jgi:hypothetical protein
VGLCPRVRGVTVPLSGGVLAQLYAMRLLLDGIIGDLEPLEATADAPTPEDGSCPHPPERQIDASVLGGQATVLCLVCGLERPGVVPA